MRAYLTAVSAMALCVGLTACAEGPRPPQPAPVAPAPKPMAPAAAAPAGNGSASEAQAKAKCPADIVVWVNTKSHIYHFAGNRDYGNTKQGEYLCEAAAKAAGDRAAENEKHP